MEFSDTGAESTSSGRRPPAATTGEAAVPPCILLADDDDEMREMLAAMLRESGYAVVEARDGLQLMARVRELVFADPRRPAVALILSDVRMPGCTALDVLHEMRRVDQSVPVVLITGFGDPALHAEALRLGADAIFDKPFDIDHLRAVVLAMAPPAAGRRR